MLTETDVNKFLWSNFFIGAVGGFITAQKFLPGTTRKEKAFNSVCGAVIAHYLTDPLVAALQMDAKVYANGAAFLLGLLGMTLIAGIIQALRDTNFVQAFLSLFKRGG
jgi:hypothetical protein